MTNNPTAAEALAEVTGGYIPFVFHGADYLVLPTSEWGLDEIEALEEGRYTGFLKLVLAEGGYDKFKATKPKSAQIGEFVEATQKALGILGN